MPYFVWSLGVIGCLFITSGLYRLSCFFDGREWGRAWGLNIICGVTAFFCGVTTLVPLSCLITVIANELQA